MFVLAVNLRPTFPLNDPLRGFLPPALPNSPLPSLSHLQLFMGDMAVVRRVEDLHVLAVEGTLEFESQELVLSALENAWAGKFVYVTTCTLCRSVHVKVYERVAQYCIILCISQVLLRFQLRSSADRCDGGREAGLEKYCY